MDFQFKRVETQEDIAAMCAVAEKVWHLTYDQLLPEGQVDYMIEKYQSPTAVTEQIAHENYEYYMVLEGGALGGFVGFAPWYQGHGEMFLSKIYLLPEFQGRGAVGEAIELVERETERHGLSRIRLTVNKGNTHAFEVYRHYGFETVESVATDIGGGFVMDDYIMVKKL